VFEDILKVSILNENGAPEFDISISIQVNFSGEKYSAIFRVKIVHIKSMLL